MNSFRAVKLAIDYEIARQIRILESGGRIIQETRGWVEATRETVSQRSKEDSHDYRYFPEPDLPPLVMPAEYVEEIRAALPEMAAERAVRLARQYDLTETDALQLTTSRAAADLFEQTAALLPGDKREAAKWILGEFQRLLNDSGIEAEELTTVKPDGFAGTHRHGGSRPAELDRSQDGFRPLFPHRGANLRARSLTGLAASERPRDARAHCPQGYSGEPARGGRLSARQDASARPYRGRGDERAAKREPCPGR